MRISNKTIHHFKRLAWQAENCKTINVSHMSREEFKAFLGTGGWERKKPKVYSPKKIKRAILKRK